MNVLEKYSDYLDYLCGICEKQDKIPHELYDKFDVKRGLRNKNGTGVLVGLTTVGEVNSYAMVDGERVLIDGQLLYRGVSIEDIVENCIIKEKRFGFEEVIFLLLFGAFPTQKQLDDFNVLLGNLRKLPDQFTEDMILKAPSKNVMNKLARGVLALYSYDNNAEDMSIKNVIRQSLELISRFPALSAYGYQAKSHYYDNNSLYIHSPNPKYSTAENILHMIRPDKKFTQLEAEILDLMLVLHAEHGGGNNSTFTTHVVTSTGTDIYSSIAAAVGSLKGPKHGGANIKVMEMMTDIMQNVKDWTDYDEIEKYLGKIINKNAFDHSGLIYGMGHAVYKTSDPRAILLKVKARELAQANGAQEELGLYEAIEKLTPVVYEKYKGVKIELCANVDLYSGFVYKALNIPMDLLTPMFATSRIVGWCAHVLEEVTTGGKIIRPAYKSVGQPLKYIPMKDRT